MVPNSVGRMQVVRSEDVSVRRKRVGRQFFRLVGDGKRAIGAKKRQIHVLLGQ
jgi:hypothetical protein